MFSTIAYIPEDMYTMRSIVMKTMLICLSTSVYPNLKYLYRMMKKVIALRYRLNGIKKAIWLPPSGFMRIKVGSMIIMSSMDISEKRY